MIAHVREPSFAELYTPKLIATLRERYGLADLRADVVAGLTVAIVALPLSMAIAIASGVTPDRGLYTAIIGGFGRPLGALAGGIFLGIVQALAIVALGSAFKNIAALSILLLFLFFRPTGLLGSAK